jgi:hypothetical protein
MQRQLQGPFSLHDVEDVEAHCQSIINRWKAARGAHFQAADEEDLLAHLIAVSWVLSRSYDSTRSTLTFSTFSTQIGEKRIVDWYRKRFRDHRYLKPDEEPVREVSLDELLEEDEGRVVFEEGDDGHAIPQVLTALACAASAIEDVLEQRDRWIAYLQLTEAAAA